MDMILMNGKIVTMDSLNSRAEAVAVKDGKFIKVGSTDEVLSLKDDTTEVIDLNGKLLVPGFNDSHMHLMSYGEGLREVDLTGTKSIEEIIERVKSFIAKNDIKPGQWVKGRGWNHDYFAVKRFPTKNDLDKISIEHPICLTRACCHVCTVNSKALETTNITRETSQVEGGHFDIDETGHPSGIFRENAMIKLILDRIPAPSVSDFKDIILQAANNALREGITSIQTNDWNDIDDLIESYSELNMKGNLPVRIYEQFYLPNLERLKQFIEKNNTSNKGDEYFKFGPLKLFIDGSLGARTALLSQPYTDDPSTEGIPVYTQNDLDELVLTAHNAGMQVAIHAIGDKAMCMAFESIEKAVKQNPRKDPRHGIIHCQITDETLLDKFKELDVIAYIQPIFLDYDIHIVEERVGKDRAKASYNWKGLIERGVHVACSSDCPVEPFNVMRGICCAVTRKDLKSYPENGWLPEQKLTVEEALYCFTTGGAYASFEENIKGSITPGKLADMVVLSEDIFEIDPDKIKDVKVDMTFVGGKLAYKNNL